MKGKQQVNIFSANIKADFLMFQFPKKDTQLLLPTVNRWGK